MRVIGLALLACFYTCCTSAADGMDPTVAIEAGDARPVIDGVGWVFGIPNKLLLLDPRIDNHRVSEETVEEAADYLSINEVDGVLVRVNQYDPLGEWRRLAENDRVGLGWRLTFGSALTLGYSVLPGRILGGDWYNPYTDTVHVYSDVPAIALEQAAQAKDTHDRAHPGFYSAVRFIPFVGLVHEARSKEKVFNHVDQYGDTDEQAEARRILMPQFGSEVGGQATVFLPQGDALFKLTGAAVGHAFGRVQAARIERGSQEEATPGLSPISPLFGGGAFAWLDLTQR